MQVSRNKANIVIEVIDTGPGINEEDIHKIFKPYYSTEKCFRQTSGLGLGLPLAKMLVELHCGRMWVKNQPGHGANIGFSIPISQCGGFNNIKKGKNNEISRN